MKLKIFCTILVCILCVSIFFIPALVMSILPSVSVVTLQPVQYTQTISASGTLQQTEKKDLYTDIPVIASSHVQPGDIVSEGEELATVNIAATLSALQKIDLSDISLSGIDYTSILSSYGVSISSVDDLLAFLSGLSDVSDVEHLGLSTSITSPISGTVEAVNISEGELTEWGVPIITVCKDSSLVAKVQISESDVQQVAIGNEVTLSGQAFGNKTYSGTIIEISDTATRGLLNSSSEATVEATISIQDADKSLKPGYSVKAKIATGDAKEVMVIPYEAVLQDEMQNEYVYVYEDSKAIKQYITTGLELSEGIEVTEGLTTDSYVIETPDRIQENGEKIMVFQYTSSE